MRFKQFVACLILILLPLLVGAYSPQTVYAVRGLTTSFFKPFLESAHQAHLFVKEKRDFLANVFKFQAENKTLLERNRRLETDLKSMKEIKQENIRLKKLLQFKDSHPKKTISAQVISRDISNWSYYAVINKGYQDGVREDMAIVTGEGLVGKVVNVGTNSARVILLIDSESRVSSLVQETREVGLIEGTGGPFLKMTYLDLHTQAALGQTVISSGYGGIYPKAIPIGEIVQIGEDKNKLSSYAMVRPYPSFSKLEEVLCVVS